MSNSSVEEVVAERDGVGRVLELRDDSSPAEPAKLSNVCLRGIVLGSRKNQQDAGLDA